MEKRIKETKFRFRLSDFIHTIHDHMSENILNDISWNVKEYDYLENIDYSKLSTVFKDYFESGGQKGLENFIKKPENVFDSKYIVGSDLLNDPNYKVKYCYYTNHLGLIKCCYRNGDYIVNNLTSTDSVITILHQKLNIVEDYKIQKKIYWFQKESNIQNYYNNMLIDLEQEVKDITEINYTHKMESIYNIRHDMIHSYVCYLFGLCFRPGTELNLKNYSINSNQTPDIFEYSIDEEVSLVGDISVARNNVLQLITKENKYKELMTIISKTKNKQVKTLFFVINDGFSNFNHTINETHLPLIFERDLYFEEKVITIPSLIKNVIDNNPVLHGDFIKKRHREDEIEIVDIDNISIIQEQPDYEKMQAILAKLEYNYNHDETINEIKEAMDNANVVELLKDKKFEGDDCFKALDYIKEVNTGFDIKYKPVHYIAIPPDDIDELPVIKGKNSEQLMIIEFLRLSARLEIDDFLTDFSKVFLRLIDENETENNIFLNDTYINTEDDFKLKLDYHNSRLETGTLISLRDYLYKNKIVTTSNSEPHFKRKKIIKIKSSYFSSSSCDFIKKNGIDFKKKHTEGRTRTFKKTVDLNVSFHTIEDFLGLLTEPDNRTKFDMDIFQSLGADNSNFEYLKKQYAKNAVNLCEQLEKTYCHTYLKQSSIAYNEILHYGHLAYTDSCYSVINTGIPNILIVIANTAKNQNINTGTPFFCCGYSNNKLFLNTKLYGEMLIKPVHNDLYFFKTNWFRLPSHRIEFFRDQYYSVMSSSLCSLSRKNEKLLALDVKGIFCLRTIISLVANQSCSEQLMDSRFAIMSGFATHTNFLELIKEKFSPPYSNCMSAWLCQKLLTILPTFRRNLLASGNVKFLKPVIDERNKRISTSVGGLIKIPGIWTARLIESIDDLLDEIFIYVHTPKEPSNIFHQEIAAVRVINDYEKLYRGYSDDVKTGNNSVSDLINSNNTMGFSSNFLINATIDFFNSRNPPVNQAINFCLNERFSELNSTKAVINDDRKVKHNMKVSDKREAFLRKIYPEGVSEIERRINKMEMLQDFNDQEDYTGEIMKLRKDKDEYHKISTRMRVKVHDMVILYLEKYNHNLTIDHALHYISRKGEVMADICIKSQYGSKREFYVMNMGAKVMARCVENFFKKMCEFSQTEMISVGGDKKMLAIQKMMDRVTRHAVENNHKIYYVNGDCSKWSASEMMETFLAMIVGMEKKYGKRDYFEVMKYVFFKWMDKRIKIPKDIVEKVIPLTEETEYLKKAIDDDYELHSTQNFLQGVFNYTSSLKADICNNYCLKLWKEFNPHSTLYCEYMVHSDDYALCVSCLSEEEFEKFRCLQKLCMKCCNITDSSKKTNCQNIFLEFISLICFNGSLNYPSIKKTKECASTLPCDDFKRDSDSVCSRTAECVRVGVTDFGSWIFHRLHMKLLRDLYSMSFGQHNFIEDRFNTPVEIFGQSDMLPVFYFLCSGDPNNYRLYKNSEKGKLFLEKLWSVNKVDFESISQIPCPRFVYNRKDDFANKIRKKLGISAREAIDFFQDHLYYNFMKPNDIDDYKFWLKAIFFKTSFIKAYGHDPKSMRLLRVSNYTRSSSTNFMTEIELINFYIERSKIENIFMKKQYDKEHLKTIKEIYKMVADIVPDKINQLDLEKAILNGDSTCKTIYLWSMNLNLNVTSQKSQRVLIASKAPLKQKWLDMSKYICETIIYAIDEIAFQKNYPLFTDFSTLNRNIEILNHALPDCINVIKTSTIQKERMSAMLLLYNTCMSSRQSDMVCLSTNRDRESTLVYLKNYLRNNLFHNVLFEVISKDLMSETNPYTLESYMVVGRMRTKDQMKLILNNLTLFYVVWIYKLDKTVEEFQLLMQRTMITSPYSGELMSVYNAFNFKTFEDINKDYFQTHELQSFCFFKKIICEDYLPFTKLTRNARFFSFYYDKTVIGNDEVCYFKYLNTENKVTFNNHTEKFYISTTARSKHLMSSIYHIGQKLAGRITESYLESIVLSQSKNYGVISYKPHHDKLHFSTVLNNYTIDNNDCTGYPIYYTPELSFVRYVYQKANIVSDMKIRIEKTSVYNGFMKLFNLQFYKCNYCDIEIKTGDIFLDYILNNQILEQLCKSTYQEITRLPSKDLFEMVVENAYKTLSDTDISDHDISILSIKNQEITEDLDFTEIDFNEIRLIQLESDNEEYFDDYYSPDENVIGQVLKDRFDFDLFSLSNNKKPYLINKLLGNDNIYIDILAHWFNLKDNDYISPKQYVEMELFCDDIKKNSHMLKKIGILLYKIKNERLVIAPNFEKFGDFCLFGETTFVEYFEFKGKQKIEFIKSKFNEGVNKSKFLVQSGPYSPTKTYPDIVDIYRRVDKSVLEIFSGLKLFSKKWVKSEGMETFLVANYDYGLVDPFVEDDFYRGDADFNYFG